MSYGLQISASGVMTSLYRQEVFANNLANLDSIGFKADIPTVASRPGVRQEDGVWNLPSNELLEKLGAGTMLMPNRVSMEQGSLRTTGSKMDVAIEGKGFLVVEDSEDSANPQKLTRDGRMVRNKQGVLSMAGTGLPVMSENDQPIVMPDTGTIKIDSDGTIYMDDIKVAKLKFIELPDNAVYRKVGHGMFEVEKTALRKAGEASGLIRQGVIEEAAVDELKALMNVTNATREVDANVDAMKAHDRLMDRAITSLGRAVI
ncbi:MAG: flagellar hook basal-body protein [Phycisphaerales bacterium]